MNAYILTTKRPTSLHYSIGWGLVYAFGFGAPRHNIGRAHEAVSISFDSVRDKNVMQLNKLNTAIFPVTYQNKFYTNTLNSSDFTKLALTPRLGAPSTSLQRLHHVEKKIVQIVELACGLMEGLAKRSRPQTEVVGVQYQEFMQAVKEIQMTLRDEIKSMCEYYPYENSHCPARTNSEISVKKLDCDISQIGAMRDFVAQYEATKPA